jgi:hypothetical protein
MVECLIVRLAAPLYSSPMLSMFSFLERTIGEFVYAVANPSIKQDRSSAK